MNRKPSFLSTFAAVGFLQFLLIQRDIRCPYMHHTYPIPIGDSLQISEQEARGKSFNTIEGPNGLI